MTTAAPPSTEEVCSDGIDQDCDGADETTCGDTTPPVITSVSDRTAWWGRILRVYYVTDEAASTTVCTDNGYCDGTSGGTSHDTGWFWAYRGNSYTITATDADGNSSTYGPVSY